MRLSINFLARMAGMLFLAYLGLTVGRSLSGDIADPDEILATQLLVLAGAGLGLLLTPQLTIEPVQDLVRRLRSTSTEELILLVGGAFIGLLFGVLLGIPFASLPRTLSQVIPTLVALAGCYIGVVVAYGHRNQIKEALQSFSRRSRTSMLPSTSLPASPMGDGSEGTTDNSHRYLLDTSAIIDGRIASVAQTGFIDGIFVVPRFVLTELQMLADSSDDLRRSKGRRGLELLNKMQKSPILPLEVLDVDVPSAARVDDKLIALGMQYGYPIITNDFNLNRVAGIQGIRVLSLNTLSEAVRPPVVQDQRISVLIRNEGNARLQGVGYLDDGTPVIVEDARPLIGQTVEAVVVRVHQTQTGRLIFAQMTGMVAPATAVTTAAQPKF